MVWEAFWIWCDDGDVGFVVEILGLRGIGVGVGVLVGCDGWIAWCYGWWVVQL